MIEVFWTKISGPDLVLFLASILMDALVLLLLIQAVVRVFSGFGPKSQRIRWALATTAGAATYVLYGLIVRPFVLRDRVSCIWLVLALLVGSVLLSGLRKGVKLTLAGVFCLAVVPVNVLLLPQFGVATGVVGVSGFIVFGEGLVRWSDFTQYRTESGAIDQMRAMISHAQKFIRFTSGTMNPRVYLALRTNFIEKLDEGVYIECVIGHRIARDSLAMAKELSYHPNWTAYQYPGNPVPHAILVDGHWLRVEDPHPITDSVRWILDIKNASASAMLFLATFERYKAKSDLIEGNGRVVSGKRLQG